MGNSYGCSLPRQTQLEAASISNNKGRCRHRILVSRYEHIINLTNMTKEDLDLYLKATDRKKIIFYGSDTEKENIAKINELQWQAIVKYYSQLTPNE